MTISRQFDTDQEDIIGLVTAAQAGDRTAFGDLFTRFHRLVVAIGYRRLGDEGEAQELCQDVFVQAMQKLNQLRDPRCFGSWLRSIANRMAINRSIRRAPSIAMEPKSLEASAIESLTPYAAAVDGERAAGIHDGLSRLKELDRETLVAFYVHGQSLIEMSNQFDAPVGTIKRRLHVARQRLAQEVQHLCTC
jgi:RNA polymerase sigma-70 factor (ECF subfamily)